MGGQEETRRKTKWWIPRITDMSCQVRVSPFHSDDGWTADSAATTGMMELDVWRPGASD